jgi:hypothetical protein
MTRLPVRLHFATHLYRSSEDAGVRLLLDSLERNFQLRLVFGPLSLSTVVDFPCKDLAFDSRPCQIELVMQISSSPWVA